MYFQADSIYDSKNVKYRNVIMTSIQYFVKNYNCSMMLMHSCYCEAISVITRMYISVIMNLTAISHCARKHIDLRNS